MKYLLYIEGRTYGNNPIPIDAKSKDEALDIAVDCYVDIECERFHVEKA
jgi:hypothetical protein